jgi:hypothetical protein
MHGGATLARPGDQLDTLAYFIYGLRRDYHLELTYSVLSAVHWARAEHYALRIALIADEANQRPDLPIEHVIFSASEFQTWTSGGYQHQAKLHALLKAIDLFKSKLALIDTDTYFCSSPRQLFDRIEAGSSIMHAYEGMLGADPYLRPILRRLDNVPLGWPITATTRLFNSGVIGLNHTDRSLVAQALRLSEQLYGAYPAFNIEQFALSIVLQDRTLLRDCSDVVRHYFGYERAFVRSQIDELFPSFSSERFQQHVRALPRVGGFPKKRTVDQIKARLKALTRREGAAYRFAYLGALSALASVERSPLHANIWAQVALDVLRKNEFAIEHIERDFDAMRRLDATPWSSHDTREAWRSFWQELAHDRRCGQTRTTARSSVPAAGHAL